MGGARIAETLTRSSGGGARHPDAVGRPPGRLCLVRLLRLGSCPPNAARSLASIFSAASDCTCGRPLAQAQRRARVPQVAKTVPETSPAPRQTSGKRTQCHSAVPAITCRHSCPARYVQEGTQWHLLVSTSTIVDAFARRRSAVRTRCGPPLIRRGFVLSEPSARPPRWPFAAILQPESVRLDGTGWGLLVPIGTTLRLGGYLAPI